ncbi:MAG: PadR family transcriptional regulator [Acidimicrobiales bacterium]
MAIRLEQDEIGFPRAAVRAWLVLLLEQRPGHGYDLLGRLKRMGLVATPGQVYRALRFLDDAGLVTQAWDSHATGPPRRVYTLTPAGRHVLGTFAPGLRQEARSLDRKTQRSVAATLRAIKQAQSTFTFTIVARMSVRAADIASARRKLDRIFATPRTLDGDVRSTGRVTIAPYAEIDPRRPASTATSAAPGG